MEVVLPGMGFFGYEDKVAPNISETEPIGGLRCWTASSGLVRGYARAEQMALAVRRRST